MKTNLGKQQIVHWTAVALAASVLLMGHTNQIVGQPTSATVIAQIADLAEAERLIEEAYELYQQRKYLEAISLVKQALAIQEKALEREHPDVATSLNALAFLQHAAGNYADAETLYKQSLAIRKKSLGLDHPDVADSLNNLAMSYRIQGRYGEAEPLFQNALAIREKILEPNHPDIATSLNNLAITYEEQGNYAEAETLYQRALAIEEKVLGPEHPDVATPLNNLASLYQAQGSYAKAELLYRRALSILEKTLGSEDLLSSILNNLAALYDKQGNYTESEPLYQRALAIQEKVLGAEHPNVAITFSNLASLYLAQKKITAAEPLFQRALDIFEKELGAEHPYTILGLNNLASLHDAQGNYEKAELLLQRALSISEKVLGPNHGDVALNLNNLASLYQVQGKITAAKPLAKRALSIFEKFLAPEHPYIAISLSNIAVLYLAEENYIQAIITWQKAMEVEETNLATIMLAGSEQRKQAYLATLSGATNATLSLHLQYVPQNANAAHLALTTLLRRKGRILDATSSSLQTLRQNLTATDQALLDQLNATRAQLANLIFQDPGDRNPGQYRQQVAQLKGQADRLETQLSQRSAEFRIEAQSVTIAAVQQQIPAGSVLVELVRYQPFNAKAIGTDSQWGSPRYAAYVLQRTGIPKWVELDDAAALDRTVERFRQALKSQSGNIKQVARDLDEQLMRPIRPLLGNANHLLLSPDSQLNLVPFAALVDENNRYLVETYDITYLTSGRDLLKLQRSTPSRQGPLLVANANFDQPGQTAVQTASQRSSNATSRAADFTRLRFAALPGTAKEAAAIAPLLPNATLLTAEQATETAIKQVQGPSILHIATHGFFLEDAPLVAPADYGLDAFSRAYVQVIPRPGAQPSAKTGPPENPLLRSGLALAGANPRKSGSDDGLLTALEATGLNLYGTQLVVLSACDTGLGDVANGEGVYGLRRAFVMAGAESQLISLWKVSDAGTAALMTDYYQRLLAKQGRSDALRQTQLAFLRSDQYQHPYYWAAFIAAGDWRPLEGEF